MSAQIAYTRDGWRRMRSVIVSATRGEWRSRDGLAFKYERGNVARAINRRGRTAWSFEGKLEHNGFIFRDLAEQFHNVASRALDESQWSRDWMRV